MEARCFSGPRLRDTRITAGLRPEQLAAHIGRSVYSIHEYERGRVCPPATVVHRIATALGVDPTELHADNGDRPEPEAIEPDALDTHVRQVVNHFPRLNEAQRSRIATLLRTSPAS